MKAVQYTAPGVASLVDVPFPECPRDGLLLRMQVAAICGSDLHFLADGKPATYPRPPGFSGHECIATVEEGSGLPIGTPVLALAPDYNAFAEFLAATPEWVIPINDDMAFEQAVLAQQLGTVIYCCRKLPNVVDRHAMVVGQGPAGLFFTMMLSRMGARTVTGIDIQDHRLAKGSELGATCVVNADRDDVELAVREHTAGQMADVVVEAVGKASTINTCIRVVAPLGTIALFGVPKSNALEVDMGQLQRRNACVITSIHAQREPGLHSFRLALSLISSGRLDPSPLVSHHLPFTSAVDGLRLAGRKDSGAVKVLLRF